MTPQWNRVDTVSPRKVEIPVCRSLIALIPVKPKYRLGNLKNRSNNVVSGSSGSGDSMLWELRGGGVRGQLQSLRHCQ